MIFYFKINGDEDAKRAAMLATTLHGYIGTSVHASSAELTIIMLNKRENNQQIS